MGSSGPGFIFLLDDVASHDRKTHSQLKDIVYLWKTYKALVIERILRFLAKLAAYTRSFQSVRRHVFGIY